MIFAYFSFDMRPLIVLLGFLFLSGCSSVRVTYDYDRATDFSTYKSFGFYETENNGLSELDNKRIIRLITQTMESKGFEQADNADFYIGIQSSEYENINRNAVGVGVGGSGRNVGGGVSVGIPINRGKLTREIVIDFVDEKERGTIWQAVTTSAYNPDTTPEKREANLKAVVDKIFSSFPPQ